MDVRAALHGEIELARQLLARRDLDDEAIHRLRQALKRARGALRLLRDAVSEAAYRKENAALRDAAAPLAAARDAAVMLGVVEEMMVDRRLRPHRPALGRLRARARETHARALARAQEARAMRKMGTRLERALDRTAHWRMPRNPQPVYWRGLLRIYGAGKEALENVLAQGSTAARHEWRKQVKYLGASVSLIAQHSRHGAKAVKIARELGRVLGNDHDLAVLAAALRRVRADAALLVEIEQRRRKLQKRALELGRRLYKRSPDRFAARLRDI